MNYPDAELYVETCINCPLKTCYRDDDAERSNVYYYMCPISKSVPKGKRHKARYNRDEAIEEVVSFVGYEPVGVREVANSSGYSTSFVKRVAKEEGTPINFIVGGKVVLA